MAISLVGVNAITGASGGSGTSVTTVLPTGITTNDLLICFIDTNNDSGSNPVSSGPSGYTFLRTVSDVGTAPAGAQINIYYKIATSSETAPTATMTSTCQWLTTIIAYRGVDTSNPFIDENGQAETGSSATTVHSAPAITNTDTGAWGLYHATWRQVVTPSTSTPGTGLTERMDTERGLSTTANPTTETSDTNGTVGTGSVTYSCTASAGSAIASMWAAFLRPATVGGTNATPTPSVVAGVAGVGTATATTGSTVTAVVAAAVAAQPAATVLNVTDRTVTPAVVSGVAAVPAPALSTGSTPTPGAVVARAAVPAPTVSGGVTLPSDTFDRADGALGTSSSGAVWTIERGGFAISGNKAAISGTVALDRASVSAAADISVEADVTLSATRSLIGVEARSDATSCLNAVLRRNTATGSDDVLLRLLTGSTTNTLLVQASSVGLVAGSTYHLQLRVQGPNVAVFVGGSQVLEYTLNTTQLASLAGTGAGLVANVSSANDDGTSTWDNFDCTSESASGFSALRVQDWASNQGSGTGLHKVWPLPPTAGNLLLVAIATDNDIVSVIDSGNGESYTRLRHTGQTLDVSLWAKTASGTETSASVTFTTTANASMGVSEWKGITSTGFTTSFELTSGTAVSVPAQTATPGSMLIALTASQTSMSGYTDLFTERLNVTGGGVVNLAVADRDVVFGGSYGMTAVAAVSGELDSLVVELPSSGSTIASPGKVSGVAGVGTVTILSSVGTVVPAVKVAGVAAVPAVTIVTQGQTVVPAQTVRGVAATYSVASVQQVSTVTPAKVAGVAALPPLDFIGGQSAVHPTMVVVAGVAAVPAPSIATGSALTVTVETVAGLTEMDQPTIALGTSATAAVAAVAAKAAVPTPQQLSSSSVLVNAALVSATSTVGLTTFIFIGEPIYVFIPPSVDEGPVATNSPLFERMTLPVGITVLRTGTTFTEVRYPTDEQLAAADFVYMGGRQYDVTGDEARQLQEAGYELQNKE